MLLERLRLSCRLTRTRLRELSAGEGRGGGCGSRGGGMFSFPLPKRGPPEGPASPPSPPLIAGGPEPPDATSLICDREGTALVLWARRSIPPRLLVATPRPRDAGTGEGEGEADAPLPPRLEPKREAERVSVGEVVGGRVLRRSAGDAVRAGDRAEGAVALRRSGERRVRRELSGVSADSWRSLSWSSGCSSAARVRFGAGILSYGDERDVCCDARMDSQCVCVCVCEKMRKRILQWEERDGMVGADWEINAPSESTRNEWLAPDEGKKGGGLESRVAVADGNVGNAKQDTQERE